VSHKTFSKIPGQEESRESIQCPLCGKVSFRVHWQADQGTWQRCLGCSLLMQNPQPVPVDILNRYDAEYFSYETENEDSFLNLMLLGLKDIRFFEDYGHEDADRSFLDIGCATGRLGSYLNDRGWMARGVEVCREAAEYGNTHHNISIFPGTLEEASFPDSTFQYVHTSHVIEHINRPDQFVQEIYRILKPGGVFLCATPNSSGFQALLFQERWRSVIADHLFLFSKKTLKNLLLSAGFHHEKTKTWGGIGKGFAPELLKRAADRLVKPLGWGDVMMMVFRKPL